MQSFTKYYYAADFQYLSGWDKYALKYASLLQPDTLYYLHKQVMYDYIDTRILPTSNRKTLSILDVNCGTGNDFPYLLSKGNVTGIDGSAGMLNKAAETYATTIECNKLMLYKGMLEDLNEHSLGGEKFDLIYSITGGFSYIDDHQFVQNFNTLKSMLNPGGVMVTAHLNTFCLSETIACILKRRFKRSIVRLKKNIPNADGTTMYLRNAKHLKQLLSPIFNDVTCFPLIAIAPPYQTDVNLSPAILRRLRRIENNVTANKYLLPIADQIVTVCW